MTKKTPDERRAELEQSTAELRTAIANLRTAWNDLVALPSVIAEAWKNAGKDQK